MDKKIGRSKATGNTHSKDSENSSSSQRSRLLAALYIHPITTLMARLSLDVMHPAARVQELRRLGHRIVTVWVDDQTPEGKTHRVAKYVLRSSRHE